MPAARHSIVDPRRVVHETIEEETILIDLDTGTYFSLAGSGPEIWALVLDGRSDAEVIAEMGRRHGSDPQPVASLTADLIERLHSDGLLTEAEPDGDIERDDAAAPSVVSTPAPATGPPFTPPVLERFTDMQHFLMLDPIHEVHDGGWPHAPAPTKEGAEPPPHATSRDVG
ncbi:MAG: PqqD family protein [Solirubrobacteraceae bacterium]